MKLRDGGIIKPIRHSIWVSNLVPVRNKNGDIRICIDMWKLNDAYVHDRFPMPLHMKFSRMLAGKKLIHLQMDSLDTT